MLAAAIAFLLGSPIQSSNDGYTIKAVVRLAPPYDVAAMNDDFQSAKLIEEKDGAGTFEVVLRPLHRQQIVPNPTWQKDDAGMVEYLKPRPAANWDEDMRTRLLAQLKEAGIDPAKLDDKACVEKVALWAMQRAKSNDQFGLWMVRFEDGKPAIPENLKAAFADNEPKGKPISEALNCELFGKGMFDNKTHGSCTSTATYMATILRAIGIPTRIILTVPLADENEPKQLDLLVNAVRHHRTKKAILRGMPPTDDQFTNHVYNEVWVGKRWVRLNGNRLGQPIVDPTFLGLMLHVYTTNDSSDVPYAETWGARYATRSGPKLSSINPYQLLSVEDNVANPANFENPPVSELKTQTIISVITKDQPLPPGLYFPERADAVLVVKEWLFDDDYHQMRDFLRRVNQSIVLRAKGHPDVIAKFIGSTSSSGDGKTQGYAFKAQEKLIPGVAYDLVVDSTGFEHKWVVGPSVKWKANP